VGFYLTVNIKAETFLSVRTYVLTFRDAASLKLPLRPAIKMIHHTGGIKLLEG